MSGLVKCKKLLKASVTLVISKPFYLRLLMVAILLRYESLNNVEKPHVEWLSGDDHLEWLRCLEHESTIG